MASSPILTGQGNLANFANTVAAAAQAISNAGNRANTTDIFPIQSGGAPSRLALAGIPNLEQSFHYPFEQGRFLERPIGDAISALITKNQDLSEKIQTYLNMNKLALDGQLSDIPRAAKFAADSAIFVQQIRTFNIQSIAILSALQANVQALVASENQMINMITANANALANLLNQICNWGLAELPSLAVLIGDFWHWNGFNFNSFAGFKFDPLLNLGLTVGSFANFSFSECVLNRPDFAPLFESTPKSAKDGSLTVSTGTLPPPVAGGAYGDPAQFADPSYIATLQSTTTAVFDPTRVTATNGTSLPTASAIISNYALPPETYQQNVVSAVPALAPAIIQPGDPDYGTTPSAARISTLRSLAIRFINLGTIVTSGFDPNLVAAWLFYVNLNRTGRGGDWLPNMQTAYTELVAPSIEYLAKNPVPWNEVLGSTSVNAAPAAIPLIAMLEGENQQKILWKLSYIEAALLGYARNTAWDTAADSTFLATYTGDDLDYVPSPVDTAPTATTILGADTAAFPVSCTYPQSIAGVLAEVIRTAAVEIANTPGFQSTRPQFRFTYDMFAQASLVDRFTQFWREFNANLRSFLAQDPYMVSFVASYPEALASAIDPLGDPAIFSGIQHDASTRNRNWTPGVDPLPVPTATVLTASSTAPTALTNGWPNGLLDPETYLARPDVQAQPIPVQIAMLRTNQSFAALKTLQGNIQVAVQAAVTNANLATNSIGMPGWEVETSVSFAVPSGAAGATIPFGRVDFDQSGYVLDPETIEIQSTNPFILNVILEWDPAGASGTRTVILMQNGMPIATATGDPNGPSPYLTQFSIMVDLNLNDKLQVVATHSLTTPQNILSGSTFLGLLDPNAAQQSAPPAPPSTGSGIASGTVDFISGTTFNAFCAVAQGTGGTIAPVNPGDRQAGRSHVPFVDGIAMAASTEAGETIPVAVQYGGVYNAPGMNWTPGGLLYAQAGGGDLTQDYSTLITTTRWIVCIGKAITSTSFLYQPQLPTNIIQNF